MPDKKTTDRDCMRTGLEWLLCRPVSETELTYVATHIVDSWPLILDRLAAHGLAYGTGHGPTLYSEEKSYPAANLFRCLELYLAGRP